MQKIDRDRLDENTGQIECGEEIGTVFLIDKETAITVKHCLLIEKPETYAKNAVLHFSVKDEEKTVKATVISEDNDSSEDLVVLRCEESIDVQPLYLVSAELDVFDELQMVGYGKSFGFEKRWIQLKNTNLLKKPNKNMILDTIDSAAMDYEGFSGSLIADYNNCIVGIANMQNVEHLLFCMNPYKEETRKKCNEINNEISKYKKYYNWDKEKILFTDGALTWLKKESPEPEFELNRESITLVRSENNCWEAYSVFKSIEYSGFPLYLRSKSLLNNQQDILVKSLLSYYPQYTWQLLLRLGKADVVKKCITREYLQSKNRKEIDELFEYVYNAIMNNIGKFQKYDPWYDQNIYTSIVASGIPILERMCAVLDYVQQGKMIDLMIRLIEENAVKDQRLLNQFISSVMNQTADYIKRTKINALLTCSMKKRENILGVVQLDPFDVFTEYELSNPLYRKAHLEPKIIKAIFNIGKQQKINRTSVLARMGQLYTWGKLTKEQEVAFGELLWSKLNEDTQLPDLEQYYFFVFMKWPHPEEIDPLKRIKKSFISEKVSSKWKEDIRGRNFTEISYWEQLAVWNRYYVDEWSAKEKKWFLELFIGCCSDMVKYWKESKYDFQFTFSKWHMKMMIRAIASFGRNGWKGTNPVQSKKLCTLLKEFYDEGIYSWEVEAMFLADEKVPAFMNEMLELMYETESDMVFSATMAVEKCLETIMDQQLKENTLLELFNLIKARKEPGLEYFLMIIHNIFYRTNSRFPSKIMKGVSQVLRLVEKYTRINFQTSTQEEFKENIKVRKQCATLAFLIYRFENTFYEGQHCPEVEEWKNICTGEKAENEFAEVKNCWLLPEL